MTTKKKTNNSPLNLDSLVADIYKSLSNLSKGKALKISDKDVDDFGENVKKAVKSWASPHKQSTGLRMSNIGHPARKLWYESRVSLADKSKHMPTEATQIKFLYGHLLEELLVLFIKMSGHVITDQQKEVTVNGIVGHMDCKIDGEVVDIKTASNFAFKKFSTGSLVDDDPFGYIAQLTAYETAEGTEDGGFLAINKESGELALFRPGPFSKPNISKHIDNLRVSIKKETPPDKCYEDIADGVKGNKRLASGCTYCSFKNKCWADANNGKGLRAFKYSTGLKYFTRVIATPKVEEIYI
jgi:hypothetical protein